MRQTCCSKWFWVVLTTFFLTMTRVMPRHIHVDRNECLELSSCDNGGTCIDQEEGYYCLCPPVWTGKDCDVDIDECEFFPCANGGICINSYGSFSCDCPKGWLGPTCANATDECLTIQCLHGGACLHDDTCECPPEWTGHYCENDRNECLDNPCLNNGSCMNTQGSFKCLCPQGYEGEFCQTSACPQLTIARTVDGTDQLATFPITRMGETAYSWERCYEMPGALASAECLGGFMEGARWGPVTFRENCEKQPDLPESNSTTDLKLLSEFELTIDSVLGVLKNTSVLTRPVLNLTEADIIYVADILYDYQQYGVVDETAFDFVLDTIDNILDTAYGLIGKAQTLDNSANKIIKALDDISHILQLRGSVTKRFLKRFLVAEVLQQLPSDTDLTVGISLANNGSDVIDQGSTINSIKEGEGGSAGELDVGIYLPVELLKDEISRLTFQLFVKSDLFSPVGGRYNTNSKVAAVRLTVNNEAVTEIESGYVTAIFSPYEEDDYLICGYWDYSANENGGGWGTDGCNLTRKEDRIICKCNHLTNFAVLIDLEGHSIPDIHKKILSIITIVGLCVSIVGLGLTILGFLMFKRFRNGRGQQVLVMLSLSMLCSAIIFLGGMDKTSDRAECIAVAVLLHYFILVSFMWMLVEGVLQYLRFVKVLGTYIPNFLIKSTIPAWGIPLIPVIIVLAIDYNMYYGGKGYCWLSFKPMLYAFIIPVAVVIFANLIVFTLVLCNLCRRRNKGMKVNQSERKMAFLHFQAALSIFVILGLTWVFGFLAIDDARTAFHYIFAILNAFQGFFIFLLFTAREKRIRQAWGKFCCGIKYKEKSATHSASDTRAGRKTSLSQDTVA